MFSQNRSQIANCKTHVAKPSKELAKTRSSLRNSNHDIGNLSLTEQNFTLIENIDFIKQTIENQNESSLNALNKWREAERLQTSSTNIKTVKKIGKYEREGTKSKILENEPSIILLPDRIASNNINRFNRKDRKSLMKLVDMQKYLLQEFSHKYDPLLY